MVYKTIHNLWKKKNKIFVKGVKKWENILGNVEKNLKFNFGKSTEVYYSCGATLNGQFWIIGGKNEKKQVKY